MIYKVGFFKPLKLFDIINLDVYYEIVSTTHSATDDFKHTHF